MSDPALAGKAVDLAKSRWGRLDSVVINHGSLDPVKKVGESSVEEWKEAFGVNVFSAVGLVSLLFFLLFGSLFLVSLLLISLFFYPHSSLGLFFPISSKTHP